MFGFDWKVRRGLVLVSLAVLAACQSPVEVETRRSALSAADTLGLETVGGWTVTQGQGQNVALTPPRTKGASALALTKPSASVRIESAKLSMATPDGTKI